MKKISLFITAIIAIISCEKNELSSELNELLIGNWSHITYTDSIHTLEKVNSLPKHEFGISFRRKNEIMEWKNTGWCGTPPIAYDKHIGSWQVSTDSVITINGVFWGGDELKELKIISIDKSELKYFIQFHETYNHTN